MAVTNASFRNRFKELDQAPDRVVDAALAAAVLRVNDDVWADLTDEGVLYLAAHIITVTDRGAEFARFDLKAVGAEGMGKTIYGVVFKEMLDSLCAGVGVV